MPRTFPPALCLLLLLMSLIAPRVAAAEGRTIVFGGDPSYPPFEWMQGDGSAAGLHVEVARAMGAAGNAHIVHRLAPWPDTVEALKAGGVDVVPMFRSEERERWFRFSEPIYFAHHAIFTAADPGSAVRLGQLDEWRVAVERSSFAHDQFTAAGSNVRLVLADTTRGALQALVSGQADYAVLAAAPANHLTQRLRLPVRRVGLPLWPREYAFAVRRDRPELAGWVSGALARTVATGEFDAISARWQEQIEPQAMKPDAPAKSWSGSALLPLLALLALAAGYLTARRRGRRSVLVERQKRSAAERDASFLARHDGRTGLPNRDHFLDGVAPVLVAATATWPIELLALRLSNFEAIAAANGRSAAEAMLSESAAKLHAAGAFAGSLAKGSFCAISSVADAQALIETLSQPIPLGPLDLQPEFAWGVARAPDHGHDAEALLHKAEVALSACIARRRTWLIYDPALEPDAADLQLVKDFQAFGRNDLFALFQPQLDLESGRVVGAEALVRWHHPQRGLIPPGEFIPLLEGAGLVSSVTDFMIDAAVAQSAQLHQRGLRCRISVNLSVEDLKRSDLAAVFRGALSRHDARAEHICAELTESGAVEDPDQVRAALERLKALGLGTAIDDFGTGFSSLANLAELPFDELKIDQLFVGRMLDSPSHRSIVRSTIEMARDLGLTVVAEGAEDEATVEALRNKGCDRVQGYAVSRPLVADELFRFVSTYAWTPFPVSGERGVSADAG